MCSFMAAGWIPCVGSIEMGAAEMKGMVVLGDHLGQAEKPELQGILSGG